MIYMKKSPLKNLKRKKRSFEKMDKLATELQLKRTSNVHLEIYLTNKNRTSEEKQKTILRYSVQ